MWHILLLRGTNGRGAQLMLELLFESVLCFHLTIHCLLPSGTKVLPRLQYDDMIGQHRCGSTKKKTYAKIWHQKNSTWHPLQVQALQHLTFRMHKEMKTNILKSCLPNSQHLRVAAGEESSSSTCHYVYRHCV